jgi:hypothetical protein
MIHTAETYFHSSVSRIYNFFTATFFKDILPSPNTFLHYHKLSGRIKVSTATNDPTGKICVQDLILRLFYDYVSTVNVT